MRKSLSKLLKALEVYGETGDILETSRRLGVTPITVEKRILTALEEGEVASEFLRGAEKYLDVLFRKESAHSMRIRALCELGHKLYYKAWIATNERSYFYHARGRKCILGDLSDFLGRPKLLGVDDTTWRFLRLIDVMWIKNQRVRYAFEVETTKSFTKAFDRCSNIPQEHGTARVFVIPIKNRRALLSSTKSRLITHAISSGNWHLLSFEALDNIKLSAGVKEADFMKIFERISRKY